MEDNDDDLTELRRKIQAAHAIQKEHFEEHTREAAAHMQEWATEMRAFLASLDSHQLTVLGQMLTNTLNEPDPRAGIMYLCGIIHAVDWLKFDNVDLFIINTLGGDGDAASSEREAIGDVDMPGDGN